MKKFLLILLSLLIVTPVFATDLTILHTSDVHGRLEPITYHNMKNVGGAARHSYLFKQVRKENRNTLILDSGDIFQGSIYYQMFKGKLTADILKVLKYDAIALGNHEFDRGTKELKTLIKKSKTQFLCANIEFSDKELQKLVKPYIIKEFEGRKILIIGVTTPTLKNLSNSDNVTIYEPISVVRTIISENTGADCIIVISHCGYEIDKQIAIANPKINIIFGGHNHLLFERPVQTNGVEIINSGEFGVYVSNVNYNINTRLGEKNSLTKFESILIDENIPSDKIVEKKIEKANKKIEKLKQTVLSKTILTFIGEQTEIEKRQTNLGRLVLKSMIYENPYDFVMVNSGSIRINRNLTGDITLVDAMEILPFENKVISGKLQGKYLKEILKYGKLQGRRYLQVYSKIKNIEDNKEYIVVTNDYIAKGKDGFEPFVNMKNIIPLYESQKDAFIDFLKKNPEITAETLRMP